MNKWKCFKEEQPELGKKVLLWRSKKREYGVGKMENCGGIMIWRSFSGNRISINSNDYWFEFPPLTISETFN